THDACVQVRLSSALLYLALAYLLEPISSRPSNSIQDIPYDQTTRGELAHTRASTDRLTAGPKRLAARSAGRSGANRTNPRMARQLAGACGAGPPAAPFEDAGGQRFQPAHGLLFCPGRLRRSGPRANRENDQTG